MPDTEASAFATLRLGSVSRAQACITIFPPRPHWPLLSFDVMQTGFSLLLRRSRMKRGTTPSPHTDRLSERLSSGMGGCASAACSAQRRVFCRPRSCRKYDLFPSVHRRSRRIGSPEGEARAFQVMATLEGGTMLARALRDIAAFDQAVASLSAARDLPSTGHIETLGEPVRDRKSISVAYYRGGLAALRSRRGS